MFNSCNFSEEDSKNLARLVITADAILAILLEARQNSPENTNLGTLVDKFSTPSLESILNEYKDPIKIEVPNLSMDDLSNSEMQEHKKNIRTIINNNEGNYFYPEDNL